MTVRQQIEALLKTGLRNCEISRKLNCRADYVSKIRTLNACRKITATDRRINKIKELTELGNSDADIAKKLCVSVSVVRHDRRQYGIKQRQLHRKHYEIVRMKQAGFKHEYIKLELNVSSKSITKSWSAHLQASKNTGTKTASAGIVSQQVDMMATTDLQSVLSSDSVISI